MRCPQPNNRHPWASYQIRKIAGCTCAGNAGTVFPRHRLQRKPLVSDPGMHHGTCITHVPWCMSGSLTRGGGENVPGIPGACATSNFTYLSRGPWACIIRQFTLSSAQPNTCVWLSLIFVEGAKRRVTCNFESEYICGYDPAPHNFDRVVWKWKNDGKFVTGDGTRVTGERWVGMNVDFVLSLRSMSPFACCYQNFVFSSLWNCS